MKQTAKQAAPKEGNGMGPKKQYLKSRPACKVTFRLPQQAAPEAREVSLVGDFNGWSAEATPMKRLKAGDFTATMELAKGREYRFRYLIEGGRWENDWQADRYEPNAFGGEDSVISC
jgi:1,4-alpha-glucan branching enzyme